MSTTHSAALRILERRNRALGYGDHGAVPLAGPEWVFLTIAILKAIVDACQFLRDRQNPDVASLKRRAAKAAPGWPWLWQVAARQDRRTLLDHYRARGVASAEAERMVDALCEEIQAMPGSEIRTALAELHAKTPMELFDY